MPSDVVVDWPGLPHHIYRISRLPRPSDWNVSRYRFNLWIKQSRWSDFVALTVSEKESGIKFCLLCLPYTGFWVLEEKWKIFSMVMQTIQVWWWSFTIMIFHSFTFQIMISYKWSAKRSASTFGNVWEIKHFKWIKFCNWGEKNISLVKNNFTKQVLQFV